MPKHPLLPFLFVGLGAFAAVVACGDDPAGGDAPIDPGSEAGADTRPPPTRADFGLDARPPNPTCKAPARPPTTSPIRFPTTATFNVGATPMMMAQRPGDGSRWYIAKRNGVIEYFAGTNAGARTAAGNVGTLGASAAGALTEDGEGGLLGFAFHPSFAQNGRLYVSWTSVPNVAGSSMRSNIGYVTSTNGGDTFTSYTNLLTFNQPVDNNHKGGGLAFGKDGYLYASFGDGGGGNDPYNNGQKRTTFFSKVLRIDVNVASGYGIPDGNPFKAGGGEPATYAYGFRNPFRISIDRETGELWVGDVGQDGWEEIDDRVKPGGNYGWPCREGAHAYLTNPMRCPNPNAFFLDPIAEHQHNAVGSITGGVVYRGSAIPSFVGSYVYGDYVGQQIFALRFDPVTGNATSTQVNTGGPGQPWGSFAEDVAGEVYAVSLGGGVYKMEAAPGGMASTFPDRLSKTGCVDPADAKKPASGLVPYGVNSALWSDGAEKERFIALPDGATITVDADGDFDLPNGTVLVKTFSIGGKRIETRLLVRHDDGAWAGYTYEWLPDESDAVLLPSSKRTTVGSQSWYFPSRSDCIRCHTQAAGSTLGLELGQLNGDFVYESTYRVANQLRTLEHIGLFSGPLPGAVEQLTAYPAVTSSASPEAKARAYLHSNCSQCHRPQGGGGGNLDLRFATPLAMAGICNVDPQRGDLGVSGAKLLVPGDAAKSLVSIRPHALGANRMPPLASDIVDTAGVAAIDAWIAQVNSCP